MKRCIYREGTACLSVMLSSAQWKIDSLLNMTQSAVFYLIVSVSISLRAITPMSTRTENLELAS